MAGQDERGWFRAADATATRSWTKMKTAAPRDDPATFEIVKNGFYKIAEEMRVVLAKTAYSPLLKSVGDYSCGLFDARGELVAQRPDLPIHLRPLTLPVRALVTAFAAAPD